MAKEVFFTLPKGLKQSEIDCDPEDLTSFQSCDDYLATVMLERERMSNDEKHRLSRSPIKSTKKLQHTITKTERTISQKISISQDRVHGVKQAVERCILQGILKKIVKHLGFHIFDFYNLFIFLKPLLDFRSTMKFFQV